MSRSQRFSRAPQSDGAREIQSGVTVDLAKLRNARWDENRAFEYMQKFGELKGCNYVPSDGSSILHLPNEALIRRELGWARDVVGLNSVRVWIGSANNQTDPEEVSKTSITFFAFAMSFKSRLFAVLSLPIRDPDYTPPAPTTNPPTQAAERRGNELPSRGARRCKTAKSQSGGMAML